MLLSVLVTGCGSHIKGPEYTYREQANSAWIAGAFTMKQGLFSEIPKEYVVPVIVDGDMPSTDNMNKKQILERNIPLSPGKHDIGGEYSAAVSYSQFSLPLVAKAGEHYTMKSKTIWREGMLADTAVVANVWIEDSHGNKVTEMKQLDLRSPVASSTYYIPPPPRSK